MSNGEVAEALRRARDLIADPEHWTQGVAARDAAGYQVFSRDPTAVRWCAAGALVHETEDALMTACSVYLMSVAVREYHRVILGINDHYGHEAVLRVYDLAIKAADEAGE